MIWLNRYDAISTNAKTDDELLVHEFCTNEFPDSHTAFFHLAQAQARLGNRDEAREACRKSLELKPGFTGADELLEELQQ